MTYKLKIHIMGWIEDQEKQFKEEFRLAEMFYQTIRSDEYVNKVNGMQFTCFQFNHKEFMFLMILN